MISFSSSDNASDSRFKPISTRSRAASKSSRCTSDAPRRTANRAASLTKLARSAPLIPGVPRATTPTSTSGSIFLSRMWTLRISIRSSSVGSGTDEHHKEVGPGDGEEGAARLTRDGSGDEGLAGAGRPDKEHALGDSGANLLELAGLLQESDDLGDLFLHRAVAGDVGERRL